MARSTNMQRLTAQLSARYPGVVIYGIGDAAHERSPSGHNEDDTPGSKPEDEDADSKPEHRALDIMLGRVFSRAAAWALVAALVTIPANQRRLLYVIFEGSIWRAKGGWKRERYTGSDPHNDHPHVSGEADNDEDGSDWILDVPQGDSMALTDADVMKIWTWDLVNGPGVGQAYTLVNQIIADGAATRAALAASAVREQAALDAVTSLAAAVSAGGGSVDSAAIIQAINARGVDVAGQIGALESRVAELQEALADRDARLAAALAGE